MRKNVEEYLGQKLAQIHELEGCEHVKAVQVVHPSSADLCDECVKVGGAPVNLRVCLICGNVACCDSSTNQHARKHYEETGHGMVMSYEPRELWMYCYADDTIFVGPEE